MEMGRQIKIRCGSDSGLGEWCQQESGWGVEVAGRGHIGWSHSGEESLVSSSHHCHRPVCAVWGGREADMGEGGGKRGMEKGGRRGRGRGDG